MRKVEFQSIRHESGSPLEGDTRIFEASKEDLKKAEGLVLRLAETNRTKNEHMSAKALGVELSPRMVEIYRAMIERGEHAANSMYKIVEMATKASVESVGIDDPAVVDVMWSVHRLTRHAASEKQVEEMKKLTVLYFALSKLRSALMLNTILEKPNIGGITLGSAHIHDIGLVRPELLGISGDPDALSPVKITHDTRAIFTDEQNQVITKWLKNPQEAVRVKNEIVAFLGEHLTWGSDFNGEMERLNLLDKEVDYRVMFHILFDDIRNS